MLNLNEIDGAISCPLEDKSLSELDIDLIIQMAWEDCTTFDAIELQFGLTNQKVIELMRKHMTSNSFEMWRKRTQGGKTKHAFSRNDSVNRFKCTRQRGTGNKIAKR